MSWKLLVLCVLLVVGCGADQTTSSTTPSPGVTAPAGTGVCAGVPSIDPKSPPDELNLTADETLESRFPTLIDGSPISDLASARWLETLCIMGGPASVASVGQKLPSGLDVNDMRVASGIALVDGRAVTLVAFRLPGHQGSELVPAVGVLSGGVAAGSPRFGDNLTTTTIAGKAVTSWTDPQTGGQSYLYPTGDTLFVVGPIDSSQADKIFAALP